MINPRLILCGGVTVSTTDSRREKRRVVTLSTHGPNRNVNIRMEDMAKVFQQHLSPRMKDLLEIAGYIYTADSPRNATASGKTMKQPSRGPVISTSLFLSAM